MTGIKRTTITIDNNWNKGVKKAARMGLRMSQVVRALVKSWVEGDIYVRVYAGQTKDIVDDIEEAGDVEQESNPVIGA